MNIVLHEPEIPFNTGNIGRTCSAAGARLHLIEPLGFIIDDKHIKRAGLDYWHYLDVTQYKNYDAFLASNPDITLYMATTKGARVYTDVRFNPNDYIMFGKESGGIPEAILKSSAQNCIRIPMIEGRRSLNLSNSVAVVLYEALRQNGFPGLNPVSGALRQ